jgi:hypothetical protein
MPPFLSSYGVSEEIEEGINSELMTILEDTQKKVQGTADKDIPHTTYLLGTLTESVLNRKTQDLNVKFVKKRVFVQRFVGLQQIDLRQNLNKHAHGF